MRCLAVKEDSSVLTKMIATNIINASTGNWWNESKIKIIQFDSQLKIIHFANSAALTVFTGMKTNATGL